MPTVLITGGTGMLGTALTMALLQKGYDVIILTRNGTKQPFKSPHLSYAEWDINHQSIDTTAIIKADYIIHLAGAGVFEKRWSKERKQEIIDSRVKSSELLIKSLQKTRNKVKAVICASAIGWYGSSEVVNSSPRHGEKMFYEEDPSASDFLGTTCLQWEQSIGRMKELEKRLVIFRQGIVLSREGGALKEFISPLRFGIATVLGNGMQVLSWIHIDDLVRLYINAIEEESWNGVYNAVSPVPVTNKQLVIALARARNGNRYLSIHVPSFLLRMILGEKSIEILKSARVSSDKLQRAGFKFHYPTIEMAMKQMFAK